MVILFLIVLIAAAVLVWRKRPGSGREAEAGWRWFAAWAVAGAAMTFSFLAGFSIGLFVLPVAAALTLWVARAAPRRADAIGFAAGLGAALLLTPWPYAGLTVTGVALAAYAATPRASHDLSA
jgi:Zn-dependent protease with chaperone function